MCHSGQSSSLRRCNKKVITTRNEVENQQPNTDWATIGNNQQAERSTETSHIEWFIVRRGYGFITADGGDGDMFVHHSGIQGSNPRPYSKGRRYVGFEIMNEAREPKAICVSPRDDS